MTETRKQRVKSDLNLWSTGYNHSCFLLLQILSSVSEGATGVKIMFPFYNPAFRFCVRRHKKQQDSWKRYWKSINWMHQTKNGWTYLLDRPSLRARAERHMQWHNLSFMKSKSLRFQSQPRGGLTSLLLRRRTHPLGNIHEKKQSFWR